MFDYTIFYKTYFKVNEDATNLEIPNPKSWDIFLSAYRNETRIKSIFEKITATNKYWLIHPEYHFDSRELPPEEANVKVFNSHTTGEAEYIKEFFDNISGDIKSLRVCIDITGFMRPALMFLLFYLKEKKEVKAIDLIYTEPVQYTKREDTVFSFDNVKDIRLVAGFEGQHLTDSDKDVLIMSAGYDDKLLRQVVGHKEHATIIKIVGFPPLMPDMYNENILSLARAGEEMQNDTYYAPANDPFVTADVVKEIVSNVQRDRGEVNLYLSPLGTKPQVVGMALFYINECLRKPISVIFPFYSSYAKEDSVGISGVWHYEVEF